MDAIRNSIINGDLSGDNAASDSPSEDIKNLQMLDVARIEDDAYFFNLLHCVLDVIAKDLREAHKNDPDAAPDDMIASQFNSIVEDVASITNEAGGTKKNLMDLLLYYFSKEIRIPLDKLTSEEKDMLMSIFERSGRYKAELRNMTKGRRKKR